MNSILRPTRGTNGYKKQYGNLRGALYALGIALSLVFVFINRAAPGKIISAHISSQDVYASTPIAESTPTPEIEANNEVLDYIYEVFGEDADTALRLLTDPECHENLSLNPDAVNTYGNTPEGSRDIGVFQINEYWQKVQAKFLFNYKVNIEIAHQLYEENGKSFKLWTCGKELGI